MKLENIRLDGGTQPRTAINEEVVAEYAEAMRSGVVFPPLTVFFDGADHWLADGFHRYHALKASGADVVIDCRQGTKRDAVLFSVGANNAHGLRRTNDDKRKAVQTLLADPEWCAWSDRKIAEACAVSHPLVAGLRVTGKVSSENVPASRKVTTKHGTESTMNTAGIAASNQQRAAAAADTKPAVQDDDDGPSAAEIADAERAAREDEERVRLILDADDAMAALTEKCKQLQAENSALRSRVAGLQGELAQAIRMVKMWRGKAEKAAA